jgi:hypothetical protein
VLLFTPLIRPLTLPRVLLTYVVPLFPLVIFWDGLVSALRAHRPEELRRMTESLQREGYTWEVGMARVPGKPPVTYVLGLPMPLQEPISVGHPPGKLLLGRGAVEPPFRARISAQQKPPPSGGSLSEEMLQSLFTAWI